MKTINRTAARELGVALQTVLDDFGKKHGLNVQLKGSRYSESTWSPKFEFATVSEDGQVQSKGAQTFKLFASSYGLEPDDLGKVITIQGKKYTITGWLEKSGENEGTGTTRNESGLQ
jgi:hypothetical protein